MPTLEYSTVYSRFETKVEAYEFLELTAKQSEDLMCSWLHSACADPYVRRLFTTLTLDDDAEELEYVMSYSVDADSDAEFITDILSTGMVISWLNPKVYSTNTINQTYSSTELKFYSEANQLTAKRELLNKLIRDQRRNIATRGYAWNSYLDGDA